MAGTESQSPLFTLLAHPLTVVVLAAVLGVVGQLVVGEQAPRGEPLEDRESDASFQRADACPQRWGDVPSLLQPSTRRLLITVFLLPLLVALIAAAFQWGLSKVEPPPTPVQVEVHIHVESLGPAVTSCVPERVAELVSG